MLRVSGVALGRFVMTDGRRADTEWDAAEMVANFRPDTVPILSRHGGMQTGQIDTLTADRWDLWFTGSMTAYPDLVEQLQRARGLPISIEMVRGVHPRSDGRPHVPGMAPLSESKPHFRGQIDYGLNLVGVALTDRPAAEGSYMWIAS